MVSVSKIEKQVQAVNEEKFEKGTSLFEDSFRRFKKNKMAVLSCITIITFFTVSIFANIFAPYRYDEGSLEYQNMPPSFYRAFMTESYKTELLDWAKKTEAAGFSEDELSEVDEDEIMATDFNAEIVIDEGIVKPEPVNFMDETLSHLEPLGVIKYFEISFFDHFFGTDEIGQDILSRIIYGLRLSLFLALTVTIVSMIIGISYGAIAGYVGGKVDQLMMRFVDFLFGVPFIFLIILLMVFFGRHVFLIFVGLGLIYWIVLARIVRGQILSLKEKEFVLAAVSNGVREPTIIFKHLVPNVIGPVIVFSTLLVPQIMLLEAFLSFIGLGVSPPDVSLGIMISDGANVLQSYSWPIIFPGLIFSIMIFCMNFIGDGLRDALDPKMR
jgi:oligopeptide transport system permease protein